MVIEEKLFSGEEAFELGINTPFELIKGRIIHKSPVGPVHGYQAAETVRHLANFNHIRKVGRVLSGAVSLYTEFNPDTVRTVDVIFISRQRLPALSGKAIKIAPELVVEIISPTDRWRDVRDKIEEYFVIGVDWVWIVEPANKSILIFRTPTDMVKLTQSDTLQGEGILEGFTLPVAELFADL